MKRNQEQEKNLVTIFQCLNKRVRDPLRGRGRENKTATINAGWGVHEKNWEIMGIFSLVKTLVLNIV